MSVIGNSGKYYDAQIYVDGSYNANTQQYSYGMAVIDNDGAHYFAKGFDPDDRSSMRNVAGEIAGARTAMQYAMDHNYHNIEICYDYKGVEDWCTGAWKANKEGTKEYKSFYDYTSQYVDIDFCHTKGHSGVAYNEICDSLAKKAINVPDNNFYYMSGFKDIGAEPYEPQYYISMTDEERKQVCESYCGKILQMKETGEKPEFTVAERNFNTLLNNKKQFWDRYYKADSPDDKAIFQEDMEDGFYDELVSYRQTMGQLKAKQKVTMQERSAQLGNTISKMPDIEGETSESLAYNV